MKFQRVDVAKIVSRSPFYKSLNEDQNSYLVSLITESEIKDAIWDCGSDKSPGPDGFTFAFYKKFWDTIKEDVVGSVQHFFNTGILPRSCNTSFIAHIPKVPNPMVISDFRPISLIGAHYKIIAKILANRLARVMRFMGFSVKWIKWISGCLLSATSSILINGSPTREFNIHRGLRQGDPLSPFLFIIAMEGLHVAVEDAMAAGLYRGFKVNTLNHSHFFFADDALFIGDCSRANIKSLASILECFHRVSGLKINFHKSNLFGVGVPFEEVELFASITGCNTLESPFSYLGLPIDCNMALVKSWDPIIDKFSKRLSKWKASLLSIGGRSTLIFSVLGAIALWARLIVSIHGIIEDVSSFFSHVRNQGVWGRIVGSINTMHEKGFIHHSSIQRRVNNGASMKFWYDTWVGNVSLQQQYPRLFRLALNRDCMIRDCWNNGWRLDWSRHISSGTNANHLASLYNQLSDFSLNNSEDTWIWSFGTSTFSVKSTREHIDHCSLPNDGFETRWNCLLPKKINILIWRVLRDRLPSRWNLSRKGVDVVTLWLVICERLRSQFIVDLLGNFWCSWIIVPNSTCGINSIWDFA
ncbi:RNA-directed DNA polymerase, eukaryota [Tanacetum coccineum]